MTSELHRRVARVGDRDRALRSFLRTIDLGVVGLDRGHFAYLQEAVLRDAQRSPDLEYAVDDLYTENDRVLLVEYVVRQDLQQRREHRHLFRPFLLLRHDRQLVFGELIEQVVYNVRGEYFDV